MSGHWEFGLEGEAADLGMLRDAFADSAEKIFERDGRCWMRFSRGSAEEDAEDALEHARELVQRMSGLARLYLQSPRPITLSGVVYAVDADGKRGVTVFIPTAHFRMRVYPPTVIAGGKVSRPGDPVRRHLPAAASEPQLQRALRLRDAGALTWVDLYRLFEVIEAAISQKTIISKGWANRTDIRRFKHTANSVSAVGDDARHGKEESDPPPNPMTINDAQKLVDTLLRNWLESV